MKKQFLILSLFLISLSLVGQSTETKDHLPLYHKGEVVGKIDTIYKKENEPFYSVVVTVERRVNKRSVERAVRCALYEKFKGCNYCIFIRRKKK